MSENETATARKFGWRSVVVGVTVALILGFWAAGLVRFLTPEDLYARLDRALTKDESVIPLYTLMETEFPEEYAAFRDSMVAEYEAGAGDDEMAPAAHAFMREFVTSSLGDIARAPDEELGAVFDSSHAVTMALADQSSYLCAAFGAGALPPDTAIADADLEDALIAMGIANLHAIAAGRDNPVQRQELQQDEVQLLFERLLEQGLSQWEANAVLTGVPINRLPSSRQCEISLALHSAVKSLPADSASRVIAAMFGSRS